MKVTSARTPLARERAPLVAFLVPSPASSPGLVPAIWKEALSAPVEAGDFRGDLGQTSLVYAGGRRIALVGLGPVASIDAEALRRGAAAAVGLARSARLKSLAVALALPEAVPAKEVGRALAEGLVLASYRYLGIQPAKPDDPPVGKATVYATAKGAALKQFQSGLRSGSLGADGQRFARDLGNAPGNLLTPSALAREAQKMSRRTGLRCKVVRKAELVKRKFGGLLGVNRGSAEVPVFIEMEYRPKTVKKTVCLIGKGITFDTGGISIKPAAGMEEMKFDMCGAAAVLGAMQAIAELKPRHVRVVGLVPATDNMPGGSAIKPGDVLTTYGGLTVEVVNTDAEGRLVLADALGRAKELKPDATIDLATLTGACVVALGHRATGLFAEDDGLRQEIVDAGAAAHERCWPLPHWTDYQDDIKSTVADVKNVGPRWGGAITAYSLLQRAAGELRWAHMDIAGTAWDAPKTEYYSGGATGTGVRTLVRFVEKLD